MAIGIPPIRSTSRLSSPVRYSLCWIANITMISAINPSAIEHIQYSPTAVKICKQSPRAKVSVNDNVRLDIKTSLKECEFAFSYLLKVTHLICGIHKMYSFAKEGANTSGYDHSLNLPLFARRA